MLQIFDVIGCQVINFKQTHLGWGRQFQGRGISRLLGVRNCFGGSVHVTRMWYSFSFVSDNLRCDWKSRTILLLSLWAVVAYPRANFIRFYFYKQDKGRSLTCHAGTEGQYRCTSAVGGCGWLTSRPCRFAPGKDTRYPLYRSLGRPPGRCGRVQKISPQPGFDPRTMQPIASRYCDWTIPVLSSNLHGHLPSLRAP